MTLRDLVDAYTTNMVIEFVVKQINSGTIEEVGTFTTNEVDIIKDALLDKNVDNFHVVVAGTLPAKATLEVVLEA